MAEILINSQSPVTHQVFWNGGVSNADSNPIVKLYDITEDPLVDPPISPNTLLTSLTSYPDENNPGVYTVNIPFEYTDRNKKLKLRWEYFINSSSVIKEHAVFVITPYVDFNQASSVLGTSNDASDPGYKSYQDLLAAERYARKQIENYTGQKFYLYDDVKTVYGYQSDILPVSDKIEKLLKLYENDILLLDNTNNISNISYEVKIAESGYGIRIDRSSVIDNTVYTANGMVPPSIYDNGGVFRSNVPYQIHGRFGWPSVPDEVELACLELMKDYFSKDAVWKNKYIKTISTFDWDFEYNSMVYGGTGNAYADKLLKNYVVDRVEIL